MKSDFLINNRWPVWVIHLHETLYLYYPSSSGCIMSSSPIILTGDKYETVWCSTYFALFLLKNLFYSLQAFFGFSRISWMFSDCSSFSFSEFFVTKNSPLTMINTLSAISPYLNKNYPLIVFISKKWDDSLFNTNVLVNRLNKGII